jgi:nitroreductase
MHKYEHIPYQIPAKNTLNELYEELSTRRSVRFFSDKKVDRSTIEKIIRCAGTAPSGANKQPWNFVAISNPDVKSKIRKAAEQEEKMSYESRMSKEWLEDLAPIGTNWEKPFIEIAPWIIVVFRKPYEYLEDGSKKQNYYVQESVGLACGMLLTAIRAAGLASLTHTPSPMNFLADILNRPENEKPFLLIPVGYPSADCTVPDIAKKDLEEISIWFE